MGIITGMILCQPDERKGCSACCGLLNRRLIGRRSLAAFLEENTERKSNENRLDASDEIPPAGSVRDRGSYICPFQGFIAPDRPGCLIHPLQMGDDLRDRSLFGKKICGSFLCPAHSLLSDTEKKDLVELVDDWYRYTVAVIDPASFLWIMKNARDACGGTENRGLLKLIVGASLEIHACRLDGHPGPVFFYSVPEYNLAKSGFSLDADNEAAEAERLNIRKTTARLAEEAGRKG